jgi:hypothetical protein
MARQRQSGNTSKTGPAPPEDVSGADRSAKPFAACIHRQIEPLPFSTAYVICRRVRVAQIHYSSVEGPFPLSVQPKCSSSTKVDTRVPGSCGSFSTIHPNIRLPSLFRSVMNLASALALLEFPSFTYFLPVSLASPVRSVFELTGIPSLSLYAAETKPFHPATEFSCHVFFARRSIAAGETSAEALRQEHRP